MDFLTLRTLFHVDMDAFFASVEIVRQPALKGKPVVVGGDPDKRGVVSTCSYEARKYGIRSAMSLAEAKKRCPQAIFLEGNFSLYQEYSSIIMDILFSFSPLTEIVGIDEAYMDVSEILQNYQGAFELGKCIRQAVFKKTGLTCSVGIGSNKLIAKIASSLAKPNGLYEIPAGKEISFLRPLPVESLPGVGSKTQVILNQDGIKTIRDLQDLGMEKLVHRYGAHGYYFYLASLGKDNRPIETESSLPKSIGAETTFENDIDDLQLLHNFLQQVFDKAFKRLCRHKMRTRGFSLKLRFGNFKTITRSHTFDTHTKDRESLFAAVIELFDSIYDNISPLRLVGISFEKLSDSYWQPTFWDWLEENS